MISVKVSYTVKPAFVETNKKNIAAFLADFRDMDSSDFRYEVFVLPDGHTFLHLSQYANERIQEQILNVPSFLDFQSQRDKSGLDGTHLVEILDFVGSSPQRL